MKKIKKGILILIPAVFVIFFLLIRDKLLFTPDFDRSDSFHLNISLKYFLAQTLRRNTLPFWTDLLQGGFPLFAEGQIGALFLPNLIMLRFFDFVTAYNFLFVFSLFLIAFGMYVFLRQISISPILSLLMSFTLAFNGSIGFRWTHLNVLQTFSLAPLIFYCFMRWHKVHGKKWFIFTLFLVSQMLMAGHFQIVFIVILGLVLWYIALTIGRKRYLILVVAGAFVLALPQIIPTYLLSKYSTRGLVGSYDYSTTYSLPVKHLLSFAFPFPFGNPKYGTYPEYPSETGIFWENTPYIGIIFLVIAGVSYAYAVIKRKLDRRTNLYLVLTGIFILLALGKNSPLYFIFDIIPFNIFRTPSKYLLMGVFFLITAASYLIEQLIGRSKSILKLGLYLLLTVNVIILVRTVFSYHLFIDAGKVLAKPSIARRIDSRYQYISFGYSKTWHKYFAKNGWKKDKDTDSYLFLNNFLLPNSNLLYGQSNFDVNTGGLRLRRVDYLIDRMGETIFASPTGSINSAPLNNLLNITGVRTLISSHPLEIDGFLPVKPETHGSIFIFGYVKPGILNPPFYIPRTLRNIQYTDEFMKLYRDSLVSTDEAVVEGYENIRQSDFISPVVLKENETDLTLATSFTRDTFVVLRKNWYPEWDITMDGKPITSYRTNLTQMGVMVPSGEHVIEASYSPRYFYYGASVAIFFIILILGVWLPKKTSKFFEG